MRNRDDNIKIITKNDKMFVGINLFKSPAKPVRNADGTMFGVSKEQALRADEQRWSANVCCNGSANKELTKSKQRASGEQTQSRQRANEEQKQRAN